MKTLRNRCILVVALVIGAVACVNPGPGSGALHRWWAGLGPVLPHETFPADCKLCHVGDSWNQLKEDFSFNHEVHTGVRLEGAHQQARCLRCHNDRGPVASFQKQGCAGCHEDVHQGYLGKNCKKCHQQASWAAVGQIEMHQQTRFPLSGAHLAIACSRCHTGGWNGRFAPTDARCETCHQDELAATTNPPHIPLGWNRRCDRCHMPTRWQYGTIR
jgi:hypothetical protein